jgi:hypothetical protein
MDSWHVHVVDIFIERFYFSFKDLNFLVCGFDFVEDVIWSQDIILSNAGLQSGRLRMSDLGGDVVWIPNDSFGFRILFFAKEDDVSIELC